MYRDIVDEIYLYNNRVP